MNIRSSFSFSYLIFIYAVSRNYLSFLYYLYNAQFEKPSLLLLLGDVIF
jgi:hypothetical protein